MLRTLKKHKKVITMNHVKIVFLVLGFYLASVPEIQAAATEERVLYQIIRTLEPDLPGRNYTLHEIQQVILAPKKVDDVKIPDLCITFFQKLEREMDRSWCILGMGEYRFSELDEHQSPFFYTTGLIDCIALVAFDEASKKSCLYHCSKMELRPDFSQELSFEKYFIPDFKHHFAGISPRVYLVGSCYNQDFFELIKLLKKHEIIITAIDIPNVVLDSEVESTREADSVTEITKVYVKGGNELNYETIKQGRCPYTSVLLDKRDGSIFVSRE